MVVLHNMPLRHHPQPARNPARSSPLRCGYPHRACTERRVPGACSPKTSHREVKWACGDSKQVSHPPSVYGPPIRGATVADLPAGIRNKFLTPPSVYGPPIRGATVADLPAGIRNKFLTPPSVYGCAKKRRPPKRAHTKLIRSTEDYSSARILKLSTYTPSLFVRELLSIWKRT